MSKGLKEEAREEATQWRQRVLDLPDPAAELPKYLPSRSPEGEESGYSQKRAEALCRRLVATHCLYGVDKNPLAVELAKLSLWLESHSEGMPLTFMDHRLVVGDSLTGPFWDKLIFNPGKPDEPIDNLFDRNLLTRFTHALGRAIRNVRDLEASVGITVSEIENKKRLKAEMDRALLPFRVAAAAWSGGVMLGPGKCDDRAYAEMLRTVGDTDDLPETIEPDLLRNAVAKGLGVEAVPVERESLYALMTSGRCIPALAFDLAFPEVFYPTGIPHGRRGFHAVLGNPPWDAVRPKAKEFFAAFDFDILAAPTKRERVAIEKRLKQDPVVSELHAEYEAAIHRQNRAHEILYGCQVVTVKGKKTGGDPDSAKLFLERSAQLLRQQGYVGLVVPSAFHANEGATGIRQLYMERMTLKCCFSFENRRQLFEIHRSFKFAVLVARKGTPTEQVSCAFYLHDDEWLFTDRNKRQALNYSLDFIRRTGGEHLSLLELRSNRDLDVAEVCFGNGVPFETSL